MSEVVFACFSSHPPILFPWVGGKEDRLKLKKTLNSLEILKKDFQGSNPDLLIISSPHSEWGFDVPLFFLAKDFKGDIKRYLTGFEEPKFYFEEGKKMYDKLKIENYLMQNITRSEATGSKLKISLIASGDTSHCLKEDGPYGFHPDGPKFDRELIDLLKEKNLEKILNLDAKYPAAAECGLRSFVFLLGFLEATGKQWNVEILSYEAPFGVGYLICRFNF